MAYGKIKADTFVYDNSGSDTEVTLASLAGKVDANNPTLTGTVTIPTPSSNDNTTKAASTAYVQTELADYATTASPTFTGTPAAPTAADDTNSTQIATTAFVDSGFAKKASPTFTGTPAAPTAADNTNTTQIATTAFVDSGFAKKASPTFTGTINGAALTLTGDLTVGGTTTTINSTTLTVDDKNIELGSVDTPSDTTADGGGITLKGATDKTFNWVDATDAWTSSEHIHVGDNKKLFVGTGSDLQIYHDGTYTWSIDASTGGWHQKSTKFVWQAQDDAENIAIFHEDGACRFWYDGSEKLATSSSGITVSGSVTDDKGDVRKIPANNQSSAYTLTTSDIGKHVSISSGGITVPQNIGVGAAITIINNSGSAQTITQDSGVTMYNTADATTGNRTLAARGMATILFVGNTDCYISGAGLS